ncbi:MAG: AAA family ATPase [bacterium]
MNTFTEDGKINPNIFDSEMCKYTDNLNDLIVTAVKTSSDKIESTHLLIVLAQVKGGFTQEILDESTINVDQWQDGLSACVKPSPEFIPPTQITKTDLHESALKAIEESRVHCIEEGRKKISEPILLLNALRNTTSDVLDLFKLIGFDLDYWCKRIENSLKKVDPLIVFENQSPFKSGRDLMPSETKSMGKVIESSFSKSGKKVLNLMRSEAESMGYETVDPRHLLLALLECENSATHYGIYNQNLTPKKIQEALLLNLKMRAKKIISSVPLDGDHFQPILKNILLLSGELAARKNVDKIAEPHILQAFLETDSSARRILEDEKVNVSGLLTLIKRYDYTEDAEEELNLADTNTVRERLQRKLVGQDKAIDKIIPYIQRLKYGFTSLGRPAGVFLFCGQSGSGKTEMAKELARSIYGSEENLIFLEMGQFNSPESMNIFVGAPPGYIGFGEGKLTNGLRDKPKSVVLFDEVEKANPRVLDALLRFLDEGKIDDPAGPVRDGSQCLVILTSNIGAESLSKLWNQVENDPNWRTKIRQRLREEFKKHQFRIEFLNRVDEIILFEELNAESYTEIARRLLKRELDRLNLKTTIHVQPDPSIWNLIGAYCEVLGEGARSTQRLISSVVISAVFDFLSGNNLDPPINLKVKAEPSPNDPNGEPIGRVSLA